MSQYRNARGTAKPGLMAGDVLPHARCLRCCEALITRARTCQAIRLLAATSQQPCSRGSCRSPARCLPSRHRSAQSVSQICIFSRDGLRPHRSMRSLQAAHPPPPPPQPPLAGCAIQERCCWRPACCWRWACRPHGGARRTVRLLGPTPRSGKGTRTARLVRPPAVPQVRGFAAGCTAAPPRAA